MTTVNNIGWAIEFASEDLRRYEEIVMATVRQN